MFIIKTLCSHEQKSINGGSIKHTLWDVFKDILRGNILPKA